MDIGTGSNYVTGTANAAWMAFEVVDTTGPQVSSITNDAVGTTTGQQAITYTFNFSEPVVGFSTFDILVTGGLVQGSVTKVTDTQYTASIVPSSTESELVVSVSSAAAAFKDMAGNDQRFSGVEHRQPLTIAGVAGNAVIDLGSVGQLIAPIQVEGKWYYLLDADKSGGITVPADRVTLDSLEAYSISGAGTDIAVDKNVLSINGVTVVMPHINAVNSGYNSTGITYPGTSANGMENTSAFDGLVAIWDLNNGTGTTTNVWGLPTEWVNVGFSQSNSSVGVWTSSNSGTRQMTFDFRGSSNNDFDVNTHLVIFQVL